MPFKLYVVFDNLNKFCSKQTSLATASQICPWKILGEKKIKKKSRSWTLTRYYADLGDVSFLPIQLQPRDNPQLLWTQAASPAPADHGGLWARPAIRLFRSPMHKQEGSAWEEEIHVTDRLSAPKPAEISAWEGLGHPQAAGGSPVLLRVLLWGCHTVSGKLFMLRQDESAHPAWP